MGKYTLLIGKDREPRVTTDDAYEARSKACNLASLGYQVRIQTDDEDFLKSVEHLCVGPAREYSITLGWYSPVHFSCLVQDGRVVEFSGRVWLCDECAEKLGCDEADQGQVSNVKWHSKGYDFHSEEGTRCLCDKIIQGGEEVWLTVEVPNA